MFCGTEASLTALSKPLLLVGMASVGTPSLCRTLETE
jgi:hypothetical protein